MHAMSSLRLFDWKRTKNLSNKFWNPYKALAPPLEHLPDAAGIKYELQLNVYRYILEKYYGVVVSAMFVVCLHPELAAPFVHEVPRRDAEVGTIMSLRRSDQCAEQRLDVLGGGLFDEKGFLDASSLCQSRQGVSFPRRISR